MGSTKEQPKKKRRQALASRKRIAREGVTTRIIETRSKGLGRDESIREEVVPFAASSSSDGGASDVMAFSPKSERPIRAQEELVLIAKEPEEDNNKDEVPLASWRGRHSV